MHKLFSNKILFATYLRKYGLAENMKSVLSTCISVLFTLAYGAYMVIVTAVSVCVILKRGVNILRRFSELLRNYLYLVYLVRTTKASVYIGINVKCNQHEEYRIYLVYIRTYSISHIHTRQNISVYLILILLIR